MTTPEPNAPLKAALAMHVDVADLAGFAETISAAITSAVRAAVPGRQKGKNLKPLIDAAEKAFVRTLRRRAKS